MTIGEQTTVSEIAVNLPSSVRTALSTIGFSEASSAVAEVRRYSRTLGLTTWLRL